MNAHNEHDANILLYLSNELQGQDLELFLAHLKDCTHCKERLEEEQALSALLHRTRPLYSTPEGLKARVAVIGRSTTSSVASQPRRETFLGRMLPPFRDARHPALHHAAAAVVFIALIGLMLIPPAVQRAEAASFIDAAVTNYQSYLDNRLSLGIRTSSPEAVAAWFAGRVPFQFRLPSSQSLLDGQRPAYTLAGARVVRYKNENAALVTYQMKAETIGLLIASDKSAVAGGGDEIRSGSLIFHYNKRAGLNVTTWNSHGITYALVSSLHGSPQHSCLICHQNMDDKNEFR